MLGPCAPRPAGRLARRAWLLGVGSVLVGGKTRAEPEARPGAEKTSPAGYVAPKPRAETQLSKSVEERGGQNPCNTPDPGFGIYDRWTRGIDFGQLIMPVKNDFVRGGQFDVMFHFHGHEAARKEWVRVMDGAVLVGIDLGLGSGPYETTFAVPGAFERLLASVERAVAKRVGKPSVRARRVGLSAWSAGYGGVQNILAKPFGRSRVDTVILLDGLHCGYSGKSLNGAQIASFTDFAKLAAAGRKLMFVSHSSIIPPGYASTTETANYLVHEVGGVPRQSRGAGPLGLELISRYTRGNFHVRGFSGNDKLDHCAHLGLYRDILKIHVKPRWNTPRASAP